MNEGFANGLGLSLDRTALLIPVCESFKLWLSVSKYILLIDRDILCHLRCKTQPQWGTHMTESVHVVDHWYISKNK